MPMHDHKFSFLCYQKERCQVLIPRNTSLRQKIVEQSTGLPGESQATMGQELVRRRKKPFLKTFNLSRELNKDVPNEQGFFFLNKIRCAKHFCRTPLYPILFCVLHDYKFSFLRYQNQRCQVLKISMILWNTSPEQKIVELSAGLPGESQATMGQDLVSREKNPFLNLNRAQRRS